MESLMKLELNLPALERLIGGDTELELSLRRQIVEEFARRHLKEIAEKATYQAALEATKQFVNEAAKEAFDIENLTVSHKWPEVGYRIKSIIETLVKENAQKAVDEALLKIIEYQRRYWSKEIENAVKKGMDRQIEEEIKKGIQQRLEAAAKEQQCPINPA
jgi:predicted nuclease of restriction endonuclease-like (RecB) superfamily